MELEKATGKRNECVRLQRPTREIELILKTISVGEAGVLGAEPLRFYGFGVCEFCTHGGVLRHPPMCALCIVKKKYQSLRSLL
ncbi:hypothetical protein BUZ47_10355 [Staphylococcus hominis]|jgi:hypothetical protein|nr:hypothetical protein BUZ47_10355 [Staphylococcus hominis]